MKRRLLFMSLCVVALSALVGRGVAGDDPGGGAENAESILANERLKVTFDNASARISSAQLYGIEIYHVGGFVSDWGLQLDTNAATFVRNESRHGTVGQPMRLAVQEDTRLIYTGEYVVGGSRVELKREYQLVSDLDVLLTTQTFTNHGASNVTLRCFDTFDVDVLLDGAPQFGTFADRYSVMVDDSVVAIGSCSSSSADVVVMIGANDSNAVLAACNTNHFGITASEALNAFFESGGADSDGALVDATLDVGCEFVLAPDQTASFVYAHAFGTNAAATGHALTQALLTRRPPVITYQPVGQTNRFGMTTFFGVAANGSRPLNIQWRHDGTNLAGRTSDQLWLTNLSRCDAGIYDAVVTNTAGSVTSNPAMLRVLVPQKLEKGVFGHDGAFRLISSDLDGGRIASNDLQGFQAFVSTNMAEWAELANAFTLTNGALQLIDTQCTSAPVRFYRIVER